MASDNAFAAWILQRAKVPISVSGIKHPLQLSGSTAQSSLVPITHRTVEGLQGKFYLPAPGAYIAPVNHSRIATHQAPHQQAPLTVNPGITSRYLLPPKGA